MRGIPVTLAVAAVFAFTFLFLFNAGSRVDAGSLSFGGTLYTPNGNVYTSGGWINLCSNSGCWGGSVDSSGNFTVTGLDPAHYTMDVSLWGDAIYANPQSRSVTITASITGFRVDIPTTVVAGTLTTPAGTASSGCVNVRDATSTINRWHCPGDNGRFLIGDLGAGTYIVQAQPHDPSPHVTSERTITVTNPATTLELGNVAFDAPFIVGIVALPTGTPVPWNDDWNLRLHVSADLWNDDGTINRHSAFDQNSKFKFGRVPAGTYTLQVNVWDTELYTSSPRQTITVPAAGLDLTATPTRLSTPQLAGTVFRPDGVTPVQGVWLNLHNDDWTLDQGSNTDQNGKYRIGGLPAGTYKLEVNPPQNMTDVVRPDPETVTITGGLTTKNITLSQASKFVSGTVRKSDGTPVFCARVQANSRGGFGWADTRTNTDGSYVLTLAPGSWNLRVEPDRSFDCPTADWLFTETEVIVDFPNTTVSQTENVSFTVMKATAIITGTVKKENGTTVSRGNVNANSQTQDGRNRWSNAQIGADGTYTLYLVGGTYNLDVWMPENRFFTRNQKVTVADDQTVTANFTVKEKRAHITGLVTDKSGKPLPGIWINGNLDCGPEGCAAWSNVQTDASGNFDLAATQGRWNIHFDSGRGAAYVYDGPPVDIYVSTETATVGGANFVLTYADVTIRGNVVATDGSQFGQFNGWAYFRPSTVTAGQFHREYGGGIDRGTFQFRVPSSLYSTGELGIHVPPNSQYSPVGGQTVTLIADATVEQNIIVQANDAAIFGRIVDGSGFPLRSCNFRGEVFANTDNFRWYGTQINPDCTYELSLLAGEYHLGYSIDPSAGFLNRPPQDDRVIVTSGTRTQKDLKVLAGDARINVTVLEPNGTPARHVWVWADNHEEIDELRQQAEDREQPEVFQGPGNTTTPEEVIAYCKQKKNRKECEEFKLPPGSEGPGGCTNALQCTEYCLEHDEECRAAFAGESLPTAQSFVQSTSQQTRRAAIASLTPVKAADEGPEQDPFLDLYLNTGAETDDRGVVSLPAISSHWYTVNAGLPPESNFMPPKHGQADLRNTKTADLTLQLREADGKMQGFVTYNDVAIQNGWVSCWSEDGNSNGAPVINGSYSLNYTFDSTYHCNANANAGSTFLHSPEKIVVIGRKKLTTKHFALGKASFEIPSPVSETFDATASRVITLGDGTTINIPGNTLASSGNVTVNATPTINIQSQKTAQPIGYGYNLEAFDENNTSITRFNGNITMCMVYSDLQLEFAGVDEDSLVPSYWDAATGSWRQPPNATQDKGNNTVCVTSDHFSAYAVVGTSGKGFGRALVPVKVSVGKDKLTDVTVGSGDSRVTITPFKKHKGKVLVGTTNVGGSTGQVVVAVQGSTSRDATHVRIYGTDGKLLKKLTPWGAKYRRGVRSLHLADLTLDARDDLVLTPRTGQTVRVYEVRDPKRQYTVAVAASKKIITQPLDLLRNGSAELVTKSGDELKTWRYSRKQLRAFDFDPQKLLVRGNTIERQVLTPRIATVRPTSFRVSTKKVTITITGEHFGEGSTVLLDRTQPAVKVRASGTDTLKVTFDRSELKKGKKYVLTVINPDGQKTDYQYLKTK